MKILAINPGSTSTKVGIFEDLNEIKTITVRHEAAELAPYHSIMDQYDFRKKVIMEALASENVNLKDIDVVVGRGGLVKPIPGGVYKVNQAMIDDLYTPSLGEHASNLGAMIGRELCKAIGKNCECYIVDPVVVDEMDDIARYSGRPELPRVSIFHALNQKAVARRYAREMNKRYEDVRVVVVHLGGGITVGAHKNGRVIDVNNGLNGEGPYSPERAGTLPVDALVRLCFSGKYQLHEVRKMCVGKGGLVAYLGTNSAKEVEERMEAGDKQAKAVYKGMAYQVAKEIGAYSVVLDGKVDAILLTGGVAYSKQLCKWIKDKVSFIAPVKVYPGEDELQALAEGVYYGLKGEIQIKDYV